MSGGLKRATTNRGGEGGTERCCVGSWFFISDKPGFHKRGTSPRIDSKKKKKRRREEKRGKIQFSKEYWVTRG